ncbi:neuroligin-4, X-linked-like isoform X1 [Biomphalaria glabrata]|uniref:Carboxylic ester hydrolase n=1 Tax=Biomphalaria glabrata TaxID=6526 RepID=A0A9W2Z7J6_BIOGL|nr:neuroligin-4, X-linked-like isoform X1 [Biomphalaria glabrata]
MEHSVCIALVVLWSCLSRIETQSTQVPIKSIMGNVVINTDYGPIRGVTYSSQYENLPTRWVNAFLGVPYAKTLAQYGSDWREKYRFHNPDDDPFWYGTYDATKYKPACPQMPWMVKETVWDFTEISEDCLYLDIYTPNITNESPSTSPTLYPVLVFLYGGGYIMGASRQYPGIFLAERFTVVVVINYRLNALGFLSTGDRFSAGNYGMFDQVKALKFVKKNIRSFRGNPNKITLMGHSAGAASVGMHILSPRSVGLFDQAIMLSGSELSEWAVLTRADAIFYAQSLCKEVGCPTTDSQQMVDCLRHFRSFEQIVNASALVAMKPGKIGNPWAPIVDGPIVGVNYAFLPDPPAELRRQLQQMNVPLLAGIVRDEGAYFIPNLPNLIDGVTGPQFQNILDEFIRYREIVDKTAIFDALNFQYTYWPQPTNYSFIRMELINMLSDYMFGAAMSETIRQHVQAATVFFYVFEYSSHRSYVPQWRGIAHGQDLDYIFGFPFINETYRDLLGIFPRQEYDYNDRNISEFMITMITNFTSTGEPTPRTEQIRFYRNVSWYHYNIENHTYLSINNISVNKINYRQSEFHFWNDYYPKLAGYSPYYVKDTADEEPGQTATFEITTWALVAVGGVLLIVVICLVAVLISRSRTKKYPKYDPKYDTGSKTSSVASIYGKNSKAYIGTGYNSREISL